MERCLLSRVAPGDRRCHDPLFSKNSALTNATATQKAGANAPAKLSLAAFEQQCQCSCSALARNKASTKGHLTRSCDAYDFFADFR